MIKNQLVNYQPNNSNTNNNNNEEYSSITTNQLYAEYGNNEQ